MTATVMGAFESQRRLIEVDPANKAVKTNITGGWQSLLTMAGSRFVTGHTYVAVIFGMLGNFEPVNTAQPPRSACLSIRRGGSTYVGVYNRNAMSYPSLWRTRSPEGGWNGLPFIIDYSWTQGVNESFEILGRTEVANASDPGARWAVDEINVHCWDTTAINSVASMRYFYQTAGTQTFPSAAAGPAYPINFLTVGAPAGTWMIYYGGQITPAQGAAASEMRLEDITTSTTRLLTHYAPQLGNLPDTEWYLGGFRGVGLGTSFRLGLSIVDQHNFATHATFLRGFMFGVLMPPLMYFGQTTGQNLAPAQADFFGQYGQYNFTSVQHTQQATSYYDTVIAAHAASFLGPVGGNNPSIGFRSFLDIDGGAAHPDYPNILGVYTPNTIGFMPCMRGMFYSLGGGTHRFRYQGECSPYTRSSYDSKTKAFDVYVCNWSATYDPVPVITDPLPGPVITVVPGREVTLNVSALPALPFEPVHPLTWEAVAGPVRGIRFPRRGYEITHARFLTPWRKAKKTWILSDANAATLITFLAALRSTEGCYRWRADRTAAEKPYRVKSFQETWRGVGSRQIEAEVLELVWYTP